MKKKKTNEGERNKSLWWKNIEIFIPQEVKGIKFIIKCKPNN